MLTLRLYSFTVYLGVDFICTERLTKKDVDLIEIEPESEISKVCLSVHKHYV